MILISDGIQATDDDEMVAYANTIQDDHGVRLIALGYIPSVWEEFNGLPNLKDMTDEVHTVSLMFFKNSSQHQLLTTLKLQNYTQLMEANTDVFETICGDGAIPTSTVAKQSIVLTESEEALLRAAYDWFKVYGTIPVWLPEEWRP